MLLNKKELISFFDSIVLLKRKIWIFSLIIPKFIYYTNDSDKAINSMEEFFKNAITYHDAVVWNKLNLVIFEGWLVMMRFLINNNPNSVGTLSQSFSRFFLYLINYLLFFRNTITSSSKDCFFKLIICVQVTFKKIYNICTENSTPILELNSLKKCISIMETVLKLDSNNFTFVDVLKKILLEMPSSIAYKQF